MSEPEIRGRWRRAIPDGLMLAGVLAWLWPIGLGGQIPVGGDVTQFFMGLMAFLGDSLGHGRLPLWNDLWGFGFPGVAESQMGVFYPPHLLLYGLLPTEFAYASSLVLHTVWGALGASWAARQFGTSAVGSALGGFVWATCGFFLIHLSHQWGYTVGSWMPWAWGLAWRVARGSGSRRTPWLLAAVLALQVLPGHFQLAFATEVGVLILAIAGGGRSIDRRIAIGAGLIGMIPLAAMQLWPTYRLARLSDATRDYEYLSGFAATPLHLISQVAPGLFSSIAALAAVGVGSVPHLARGVVRICRAGPALPRDPCRGQGLADRPGGSRPCDPGRADVDPQSRPVRSRLFELDPTPGLLVLPCSLPLGARDEPGAGPAGGPGIRRLAGSRPRSAPVRRRELRGRPVRGYRIRTGIGLDPGDGLADGRLGVRSDLEDVPLDRNEAIPGDHGRSDATPGGSPDAGRARQAP